MPVATFQARFSDYGAFERALGELHKTGATCYEAYSPTGLAELEDEMPTKGSADHAITFGCGVLGLVVFFLMCVLSSLLFKLITGGKPPVSNVPFVIVAYEGTILIGSIGAFLGVLWLARLFPRPVPETYNPAFTGSNWGIELRCERDEALKLVKLLRDAGAVEINEFK